MSVVNRRGNLGDDRSGSPGALVGFVMWVGGGVIFGPQIVIALRQHQNHRSEECLTELVK